MKQVLVIGGSGHVSGAVVRAALSENYKVYTPALEGWSLNHWTTREVPKIELFAAEHPPCKVTRLK